MSRGLGTMQRQMLFGLAQHEVGIAETAAGLQLPYRSPDRWSLRSLTYSMFFEELVAPQRAAHERWQDTLRRGQAGDKDAQADVVRVINLNNRFHMPTNLDPTEFEPRSPTNYELQRFHPSRAIVGLERHGFVLRDHHYRIKNLALTVAGFAEARRLVGVPNSEIVDLDRVQANWREPDDFWLGYRNVLPRDDDADGIKWAKLRPSFVSVFRK